MAEHKHTETFCPYCGYQADAASNVTGSAPPAAGDYSVCVSCCGVAVFTTAGTLRYPRDDEIDVLAPMLARLKGRVA